MTVQPGWYTDPAEPNTQRYWDGGGWIGAPLPADATPPPGPPPAEPEPPTSPAPGTPATDAPGSPGGTGTTTTATPTARPTSGLPGVPGSPVQPGPPGAPPVNGVPPWPGAVGPPSPGQGGPVPPAWGYPPSVFPVFQEPRPHGKALAPLGARLAARLIDIGAVLLLNVLVNGWFVWRYVEEIGPVYREIVRRSVAGNSSTEGLPPVSAQADWLLLVILVIAAALWFAYEVPSVANTGQTFGKRVLRLKVVSLGTDEKLGFGRSARRWNTLGLPTFFWYCCGLGFLLQLVDCAFVLFDRPLRQALHDKRAQTVVVRLDRSVDTPSPPPTADRGDTPGGPTS
ncbi:RDD family protein [Micromonospora sp. NBC_01796]|uniref:RDD family protein n=1 Tax=Micromonospora sp. NBC_01796 TaxID=2975987 RepID=UPI002DD865C7|nr:RDD family protein [Micromonospora sp. NBC_01796]WSA88909.1 RDD family protein [Micromonospora sp. NBC_01796]